MSIFSNWGKNKGNDSDPEATKRQADEALEKIKQEKEAFLASLRVEEKDLQKPESKPDNLNSADDDEDRDERERERPENGKEKEDDDDERIR